MVCKESSQTRTASGAIGGTLKSVFVGLGVLWKQLRLQRCPRLRPGRGAPDTFEVNDGGGEARCRSDCLAVWSRFGVDAKGDARVFMIGLHASEGRVKRLVDDFSLRGLGIEFCNDFEETLNSIAVSSRRWNLLVVDVERMINIEEIVSAP